jgi:anti-sigma B factor antagonist
MQERSPSESEGHAWVAADDGASVVEPGRLTVELITDAQGVALRLVGELDLETSVEFDRRLAAIDQARISRLLIDLGGVTFMDSRGLSSIVRAHQSAEADGHTLVVRRGSNQVQRLFALTGIDERLTFED